jgi:hypothetical protein
MKSRKQALLKKLNKSLSSFEMESANRCKLNRYSRGSGTLGAITQTGDTSFCVISYKAAFTPR